MKTNQAGVDLIKEFEGFVDHWYPDPATGGKPWTVAYGHTDAAGPPYYATAKNKRYTRAEGEEILKRDLEDVEQDVDHLVTAPLTPNQFAALVSFTYNVGIGNFKKSTLLRKINNKDYAGAAAEFPRWNKAAGKVMKGLTRRRAAEQALFRTPGGDQPVRIPANAPVQPTGKPSEPKVEIRTHTWGVIIGILGAIGAAILKMFGVL